MASQNNFILLVVIFASFPSVKNAEIGYESATVAVVKIIFEESGVSNVVVNSRILNVFKKKISVLQTA